MEHIAGSNPNYLWLKERGNDYGDWLAISSTTSRPDCHGILGAMLR
jgi:hypothetical protein